MNNSEVLEKLKAYLKCQKRQVKGIYEDCNENLCDNCDLCYAQGNTGEHIEAVEVAVQAFEKLADYEDLEELTGISIKELARIFRNHIPNGCQHPKKAIVLTDGDVDKWREYQQLEENDKNINIPDEAYFIKDGQIQSGWVQEAVYSICRKTLIDIRYDDNSLIHYRGYLGNEVFLTKSEAEAKLKELSCKENSKDI